MYYILQAKKNLSDKKTATEIAILFDSKHNVSQL